MSAALELARQYMDCFYGDAPLEMLKVILADDLDFEGPFLKCYSADEYVSSLESDPPVEVAYEMIKEFENGDAACLVYLFRKADMEVLMSQYFEVEKNKISKIRLVFDSGQFS